MIVCIGMQREQLWAEAPPVQRMSLVISPTFSNTRGAHASYPALLPLARPAPTLSPCLHHTPIPTLHRVAHGIGSQRRGTYHHPVPRRTEPPRRLESFANLRRVGRLGTNHPGACYRRPDRASSRTTRVWLPRRGWRRHQGTSLQQEGLGHLHLPRVHRSLPQPCRHRACPQRGGVGRAAATAQPARLVLTPHRPAVLPPFAATRWREVANHVRAAGGAAAKRGPSRSGPSFRGFRGCLRGAQRGAAADAAGGRTASCRVPDAFAWRCPAARSAAGRQAQAAAWSQAEVGAETAASAAGWPLAG